MPEELTRGHIAEPDGAPVGMLVPANDNQVPSDRRTCFIGAFAATWRQVKRFVANWKRDAALPWDNREEWPGAAIGYGAEDEPDPNTTMAHVRRIVHHRSSEHALARGNARTEQQPG